MDKTFNNLVGMYHQAKDDNKSTAAEKQAEIINQMKENLIKRNGGNDNYESISIADASFDELLKINNAMGQNTISKNYMAASDNARDVQIGRNKYNKGNPYGKID